MNSEPDDDALTWAGDSDPTLHPQPRPADPGGAGRPGPVHAAADAELPDGWSVPGRTAAAEPRTELRPASQAAASAALVGMGILAGIYLLYAIGWFIGVSRTSNPLTDPVGQFMFSLGAWTAVASPLVWFGATFQLTRDRPRTRVVFLLLGVVLLAPLPFIIGAGGAS
ncbi:MAG: polymerase subunit gamma/tau [Microbacteriaceae bacterium]|nr:polymerase subunit gamma/tau [Microbacteriaceae bacterium]